MKKIIAYFLIIISVCAAGCKQTDPVDINPSAPTPAPQMSLALMEPDGLGMIAAGDYHTLGLRYDGTVIYSGNNTHGQCRVSDWKGIRFIAANGSTSVGVKDDGTLIIAGEHAEAWKEAEGWNGVVSVALGDKHLAALFNDGAVKVTGEGIQGHEQVLHWSGVVQIAAAGSHTVGLLSNGTVVAAGDNGKGQCDVSQWQSIAYIAAGSEHTLGVTDKGSVKSTSAGDGASTWKDVSAVYAGPGGQSAAVNEKGELLVNQVDGVEAAQKTVVQAAFGLNHIAVMYQDGSVDAWGATENRQCSVEFWRLRPYVEGGWLLGIEQGSQKAQIQAILQNIYQDDSIELPLGDEALGTGAAVSRAGEAWASVVIFGDVNGDGTVAESDATAIEKHIAGEAALEGAFLKAANVADRLSDQINIKDVEMIRAQTAGNGRVCQLEDPNAVNRYADKFYEYYNKNTDTIGWITIEGTNIDYPVMYGDNWYYHERTPEKKSDTSGSIYTYHNQMTINTPVTGHNARRSKTKFHMLHEIQNNAQDLLVYKNRVWGIHLFDQFAYYEVFALYETKADEPRQTILYNTQTMSGAPDSEINDWINYQLERSEIDLNVVPDTDDTFITLVTCGDKHDSDTAQSRLYLFLRKLR